MFGINLYKLLTNAKKSMFICGNVWKVEIIHSFRGNWDSIVSSIKDECIRIDLS